jgi:hypothetical protein
MVLYQRTLDNAFVGGVRGVWHQGLERRRQQVGEPRFHPNCSDKSPHAIERAEAVDVSIGLHVMLQLSQTHAAMEMGTK